MSRRVSTPRARTLALLLAAATLGPVAKGAVLWKDSSLDSLNLATSWWTTEAGTTDATAPTSADVLRFGGSGQGASITGVNLGGSMTISGIRHDNNTGTPNYNVVINGSAGQVLTLNAGTSDVTGMTNTSYGIAMISGTGGSLTLNADVALGATQQWVTGNTRVITMNNALSLGAFNLGFNVAGGTQTIAGVISGSGSITKAGAGTLNLNNEANTFTGSLTAAGAFVGGIVNVASLKNVGSADSLGNQVAGSRNIALNGTSFYYNGASASVTDRGIDLRASSTIQNSAAGTVQFTSSTFLTTLTASARTLTLQGTNTGNNIFGGAIANSGTGTNVTTLTKSGTGTWVLTGASTATGGTIINQGTLRLSGSAARLPGVSGVTTDAGNIWFTSTNTGAILEFEEAAQLGAAGQIRFRNSGGTAGNGGMLRFIGTTDQVVSKDIQCDSTIGVRLSSESSTAKITFNGSLATIVGGTRPFYLEGSSTMLNEVTGAIGTGINGFYKRGTGTWVISGDSTFTVAAAVQAGTLILGHANALGTTAAGTTVSNGAVLDLKGQTVGAEALNLSGTGINSGGVLINSSAAAASISGAVTLAANSTVGATGGLTLSGAIGGAFSLTKQGAGTLALTSASSTFSGGTFITEGALSLGTMAALGAGNLSLGSGTNDTQLVYTGSAETSAKVITMAGTTGGVTLTQSGDGNLNLTSGIVVSSGGAKQLTLQGSTAGTGELSGSLADGSGSVVNILKTGSGTWTLSGANTYTGTTEIAGGTLALGAAGVINDANTVNITGGTLSLGDNNETVSTVSLTSGSITGGTGVLTATSGVTANIGDGVTATLGATTGGSSALTKQGLGTLSVTKALGHSGGTTVSAGTLSAGGASVLTGDITVAGGTLALGANNQSAGAVSLSSGNITGTAELTATSFAASNGSAASISAVLAGSGVTLSKSGAGVLTLSAANTYTGLTSVNAGTLSVTGSIGAAEVAGGATLRGTGTVGNVTLANGSILEGGVSGSGTLTVGDVTVASGAVANLNVNNIGAYTSSEAIGLGNVTLLSGSSIIVNVTGPFVSSLTPYLLFTYDNASNPFSTGSGGNLSVTTSGMSSRLTATTNLDTLGSVYLTIGGSKVIWGSGSSTWQNDGPSEVTVGESTVPVWTAGGVATAFGPADDVVFGNGGSAAVDIASTVNPGSIEFSATSTDYVFTSSNNSKITGTGSVTKSGSSKVTLSTANDYSGGTTVTNGRLLLGNNAALGTGTINLNGGALSSDSATARTITNNLVIGGTVTLGDATENGALTFQTGTVNLGGSPRQITVASDVTLAGTVSNGGITKAGNGVLTLSGANDFAGGVSVTAGRVRAGSGSAFGTGAVTLASGTAVSSDSSTARVLGNAFALTGNATVGNATENGALTLSGAVDLAGNTLTVASSATFSGSVTAGTLSVSNGTLSLGASNVLASATAVTLASGTTFNLGGFSDTVGDVTVDAATVSNGTLTANSVAVTSSGAISANLSGSGSLTKTGNGTLTLSGANSSYSGAVTVNGGKLALGSANAIGSGALTLASGTTLASDGGTTRTLTNNLTLSGNVTLGDVTNNGTITFSTGTVDLADGNRTITTDSNVTLGGVISSANAASGALTKAGAGTLTLSGTNTYTGGTTVTGGAITLGKAGVMEDTGAVSLGSGTTFNLGGFSETVGDVTVDAATISNGTLTANSVAVTSSGTISAVLAGAGTLTKSGNGNLTLTGANTISGNVSITGGTLSTGTALGTSAISVGANGALAISRGTTGNSMANALSGSGAISYTSTAATPSNGELGLTGASSFSGTITVNSGKLAFENAGSLGGAPILSVASGATVSIGSGFVGGNATITNLTGGGTINTAWQGTTDTRTLSVNSTASSTFSGVLADAGSLSRLMAFTKTGSETLVLTGTNTYTGATTISAGTLQIGDGGATGEIGTVSATTAVTVSSGATLRIYRSGTLNYQSSARLRKVTGAGDIILEGTGADKSLIVLNAPGTTTNYTGDADSWTGFSGNLYVKGGAQYITTRNGSTAFGTAKVILGDATTSGSIGVNQGNWTWDHNIEFVGSDNYIDNQTNTSSARGERILGTLSGSGNVTFKDTGATMTSSDRGWMIATLGNTMSGVITVDTYVRVGGSQVKNPSTIDYTAGNYGSLGSASVVINSGKQLSFMRTDAHEVSNLISGAGKLQIGSATALNGSNSPNVTGATTATQVVTLSGANTYSGGTELVQGGLTVSNLTSTGGIGSGYLAVKTGGTLNYTGDTVSTSRALYIDSGAATFNVTQAGTTLTFTDTTVTKGGASGGLITKAGNGILELSGAITTGGSTAVAVTGGTLRLSGANTYAGTTSVSSGATFELSGSSSMATNYSGAITADGALSFKNSASHTINSVITGAGAINVAKTGGTLTLGGASTGFTGTVSVSGGTLTLSNAGVLTNASSVSVTGGTLNLGGLAISKAITLNGGDLLGAGSYSGTVTILSGSLTRTAANSFGTASTINLNGGSLNLGDFANSNTINYNGGTLSGLAGFTGSLNIASGLSLGANASFAGAVSVASGNTLTLGADGALGTTGSATITSGAALDLNGKNLGSASLTIGGSGVSNAGALTNSTGTTATHNGAITLGSAATIGSGDITLGGTISGAYGLTKSGNGNLTLNVTSNAATSTTVSGGTLTAGNANALGGTVSVTGGTLNLNGQGVANTVSLAGGTLAGASAFAGTVNVTANSTVSGGTIAGTFDLGHIVNGTTNTVTASSATTFTGTLQGQGTITGDVTIAGTHNPGNSPGIQTITGNLEYTTGASITWELWSNTQTQNLASPTFDQINVSGDLTFGNVGLTLSFGTTAGGSSVSWTDTFWDSYHSWTIFNLTGAGTLNLGGLSIVGATAQTIEGKTTYAANDSTGTLLTSSTGRGKAGFYLYVAEGSNDLQLVYRPIPEPSTYGLMLGGLALAAAAIRRRRAAQRAARA